jgi:hypothetical protein
VEAAAGIWELLNTANSHGWRRVIGTSEQRYPPHIPVIKYRPDGMPVHVAADEREHTL